jgi:hypothetical protein
MDKISITRHKKYNSDKTYIQISKDIHLMVKEHCKDNNIKIKKFVEEAILIHLK